MMKNTEHNHKNDESRKYSAVRSDNGELVEFQPESFWSDRPALWFIKIEAQLVVCNIEEDTRKYSFVVSLLDQETALEVKDIIINPPLYDRYGTLKDQLIDRTITKNEKKIKETLCKEKLGSYKPSQFYSHLKNLAGPCVREEFIQEIWINCLPAKIRSVLECLSSYKCCHLNLLTNVADRVHEVLEPAAETQSDKADRPSSTSIECLMKHVEDLTKQIQSLKPRGQQCKSRFKGGDVSHTHPTLKANVVPVQNTANPCRYHTKYGIKFCKLRQGL